MMSGKHEGLQFLESISLKVPAYKVLESHEMLSRLQQEDWKTFLRSDRRYAVRSSAHGEDSLDQSFAGLFETYLEIEAGELARAIEKVRKSLHDANAKVYSSQSDSEPAKQAIKMDVIVQEMIHPDIAGILFTAHPRGLLNEMVVQLAYGQGKDLVDGKTIQTTYYYNPEIESLFFVREDESPILEEALLQELLRAMRHIKKHEAGPSDVEFCIRDGKIYFLQRRAITSIDETVEVILDNSNIVESYPGLTLPLSASFANLAYKTVFEALVERMLGEAARTQAFYPNLSKMVRSYQGRMYYQISNWYRLLKTLPFSKKFIPIWQESMGVQNKLVEEEDIKLSLPLRLRFLFRLLTNFFFVPKKMQVLDRAFIELEQFYREHDMQTMGIKDLSTLFDRLKRELRKYWDITLLNDLYAFLFTGLLRRRKTSQDVVSNESLAGIHGIASMEPVYLLQRMLEVEEGSNAFGKLREDFLDRFGDRALEELKLESQTFRQNPNILDQLLDQFRQEGGIILPEHKQYEVASRGFWNRFLQKRARLGIKNREMSRFHRSRLYGMVREMLVRAGQILVEEDRISSVEDVFYLQLEEVFQESAKNYKAIVEKRRIYYDFYAQVPAYPRLEFSGPCFEKQPQSIVMMEIDEEIANLTGQACSDGIVEAEVLVITKPNNAQHLHGKILVAPFTDPAWAYLLVQAKGLITEKGSLLSHTGIISRELGIPCITQVHLACKRLRSGDRIRMNGSTGEIEVLSRV